jgi:hypothetical protein
MRWLGGRTRRFSMQSENGLQSLVGNDVEQLESRSGGARFALLPFAYGRCGGVQMMRKHGLAELQRLPKPPDICRTQLPDRRRTEAVELAQRHLPDGARSLQYRKVVAKRINDPAFHS